MLAARSHHGHKLVCLAAIVLLAGLALPDCLAQKVVVRFSKVPTAVIESRLRRSVGNNLQREKVLEQLFAEAGCSGARLKEQRIRHDRFSNVICTLPGTTDSEIVVGAHFDHTDVGRGVVDNWSGAGLLPSLFESLASQPRNHTLVFIGFGEEERGLVGSSFYVKQLTPEEKGHIRVMIDLDSLGLSPTKIWMTHSDRKFANMLFGVAQAMHLPLAVMNADLVGDDDSHPFIRSKIPTIMLHSVTAKTFPVLHSSDDKLSAIHTGDYYNTYRLVAEYLAYLDGVIQ